MKSDRQGHNIPEKTNRILNIILVAFFIILVRLWYLEVIQYNDKVAESRRPRQKVVREPAQRGTITDRFGVPLALNKIQYNAAILYYEIRDIPSISWEQDESGKKIKKFARREYINKLAKLLSEELGMDEARVIDLIHAKAALYGSLPFVLKEDIDERSYYRLKMLEKDWPGIHVQRVSKRHYPKGKVAADIIGYMGAINREEYENILSEIQTLEIFVRECDEGVSPELPGGVMTQDQACVRLNELRQMAYSIHDYVGKSGIEARFEKFLRGYHGRRAYDSDAQGNFLRELDEAKPPQPGQRIELTISIELQEYAEKLLAQNDRIRETRAAKLDNAKTLIHDSKQPWVKGGAVVAMDPNNGEILAMASFPRFDPNDFVPSGNSELNRIKNQNIGRWFESESYLGEIWDQKRPLEKEIYDDEKEEFVDYPLMMTWDNYLKIVLPKASPIKIALYKIETIGNSVELLRKENLEDLDHSSNRYLRELSHLYDKMLTVDLLRLCVNEELFDEALLQEVGHISLGAHKDASAAYVSVAEAVKKITKDLFHDLDFKTWREMNEKSFLKQKREEEKIAKKYPKPYLDYLDAVELKQFEEFWDKHRYELIIAFVRGDRTRRRVLIPYVEHLRNWYAELAAGAYPGVVWRPAYDTLQKAIAPYNNITAKKYMRTMRGYADLNRPLLGKYKQLRKQKGGQIERNLAAAFYPLNGYGYARSQAYRQSATQGSIFKLVTGYAALCECFKKLEGKAITGKSLNPFEIEDHTHRRGKDLFLGFLPDGTPLPRSYKGGRLPKSTHVLGKVDIIKAFENSSNPYFSLLASDVLSSPEDLANAAKLFSYGSKTGIELPAELSGRVPTDLSTNRTGLYSMAIGQHSLVVTPLQTAVMLSAIANGGKVLKPKITSTTPPNQLIRQVFLPDPIRKILMDGMRRVVVKTLDDKIGGLSRFYQDYPEAISDFIDLRDSLVGKTSTAESAEYIDLDRIEGTNLYTHVWFGGISFSEENPETVMYRSPELVVVVYLRSGAFGKEAAPLAAQIVKKWREIKNRS